MSVVLLLFCLVKFAGCLQINVQQNTVKKLQGQDVLLRWTFTKTSGEKVTGLTITFVKLPSASTTIVAFGGSSGSGLAAAVQKPYATQGWSVSVRNQEVILTAKSIQPDNDGKYALALIFNGDSKTKEIRLKVLVLPYFPSDNHYTEGTFTHNEGTKVTIKCEPEGSPKPITNMWTKNNVPYVNTTAPDYNLVFQNVGRPDSGTYICQPQNEAGFATKLPTTELIVKYKPVNTKFNVTGVLVNGEQGKLECTAEADPPANYAIVGGGISEQSASGVYIIPKVFLSTHNRKDVTCTPRNRLGSGKPVVITLDVKVKPKILSSFPNQMDAIDGRNFSLSCSASGKPATDVVWLHDGREVPGSAPSRVVETLTDSTYKSVAILKLAPVQKRQHNGNYRCEARNGYGRAVSSAVKLNLLYLPVVTNVADFRNREVRVGAYVKLNCKADGNPPAKYYVWRWENGTVIQNQTVGELFFPSIQSDEGGRLACAGISFIGEGKKQYIHLYVRVPPRIILAPRPSVSLNESERLELFCNASGVPEPQILWLLNGKQVTIGEKLDIYPVDYSHRGTYTCVASNGILPNDTAYSNVTIYFRPVIETNTAADTIKGAESGTEVQLVCNAKALPPASLDWLYYPSRLLVNESDSDIIKIDRSQPELIVLKLKARVGAKYLCYAYNNRGNATQLYEIRPKGTPEAPVLDKVETFIHTVQDTPSSVRAYVTWTPGYDGGLSVWYKISYWRRAERLQETVKIDDDCNCYTITKGLEANTDYLFFVRAHNSAGPSNNSNTIKLKTKAFFGTASVRWLDDGNIVLVTFVMHTENITRKVVRYRQPEESSWLGSIDVELPRVSLELNNLDSKKAYEFQVLWYVGEKLQITSAGKVDPVGSPDSGKRSSDDLTKEEIIAIIAGVGGLLLIVILVLFLCLIRRRQKPRREEPVVVMRRQAPGNSTTDFITRRSLIGSVEDDPFESAHYGSGEKKKDKNRDSYYLPGPEDLNTFSSENTARRSANPAENSQAYQPYRFGKKPKYRDGQSSSDEDTFDYNVGAQKGIPSDEELSSEPAYARPEDLKQNRRTHDTVDGPREGPKPNSNDVYSKVNKGNNRPGTNGRGAPPPYRPRSAADTPQNLPAYPPDDQLDLDDPSTVPYDDLLPPPMPVLPSSRSVPDDMWDNHYPEGPLDSVDATHEINRAPSRNSLPGKPYINVHGKLVRPGSSGRLSSSAGNIDDDGQRSPEPEVPSRRSRNLDLDVDERNLVSYLV